MRNETINLTVEETGDRLDKYVTEHLSDVSRSQVQKLIGDGCILVNDRPAKAGIKLNAGDRLTINLPPPVSTTLVAEDIPVRIIYEDDDVMVIDKPPGLAVHPAPG